MYQQTRKPLRYDETPLGYNHSNSNTPSFDDSDGYDNNNNRIRLSTSASFDNAEYFLSSSSLIIDDDDTKSKRDRAINHADHGKTHRNRRRSLSEGDGDDYNDYHTSLRDPDDEEYYAKQDDLSRAYVGLSQQYHGPLATKIALLRKQSSDIDSQLSSSSSHMTTAERRALLGQKVEIEKTLGLMVQPTVNSIVRKRDSMDMSLLEHRRRFSGEHDSTDFGGSTCSSNNHASYYSASSHRKNSMAVANAYSAGACKGSEATDSLKTFKTHNTSASSGFSAATAPTSVSYPGNRRGSILGQVFRGGHAALANRVAENTRLLVRQLSGDSLHSHDEEDGDRAHDDDNDDGDDSFFGNIDDGINNGNDTLANNDDSFNVGSLGSRNGTLRASDHLFLSDEIFTSPSLRCLSITSRESLKKLKNVKVVHDDDQGKETLAENKTSERATEATNSTLYGRLMTYDEYKAATATSSHPSPDSDSLAALSKINQRRRRATMSFDSAASASTATGGTTTGDEFAPPSRDTMEAFARINLRKARRATMEHSSSITKNDNATSQYTKPPNMKPGEEAGLPSKVQKRPTGKSTSTSDTYARRPSLWGGILNTLSSEVAPLPVSTHNRRSSDGPGAPQQKGDASELRTKGRVYSM